MNSQQNPEETQHLFFSCRATEEIRRAPPRKLQVTRHAGNRDEELQQAGKQEEGSSSTICRPAWTTYEHPFVLLLRGPCLSKAQAYLGTSALQYNSPQ